MQLRSAPSRSPSSSRGQAADRVAAFDPGGAGEIIAGACRHDAQRDAGASSQGETGGHCAVTAANDHRIDTGLNRLGRGIELELGVSTGRHEQLKVRRCCGERGRTPGVPVSGQRIQEHEDAPWQPDAARFSGMCPSLHRTVSSPA